MIEAEARGAWRQIEAQLRPYVRRRLASDVDVEDVVQEVFVKIHRGLSTLRNNQRFGPWVYTIASNVVTDHLRQRLRTPVPIGDAASCSESDGQASSDKFTVGAVAAGDNDQLRQDLEECVAFFVSRLSSPYREAVALTELQGLTQQEAATKAGISLSGMKLRVQRGRAQILDMFEACCRFSVDARGKVIASRRAPSTSCWKIVAPALGCGPRVMAVVETARISTTARQTGAWALPIRTASWGPRRAESPPL